ncbi:MAG: aldo/keto reductase, partial [Ignavibacteria bacterium]|nr:aldo/keto reductase [Ignavibacteria bacterium]
MSSSESTKNYISKYPDIKSKVLGKTGFHASICGFGCYRIDDGIPQHQKALEKALLSGINLIDTSSNYSDGGSETLVGKVLNKLISENKIVRENVIVVSKGGYLQGSNLKLGMEREQSGKPFKDVVKCSTDLWHCVSPDFLANQITLSLERLQLEKIDVYLLHNPEYFLTYSIISDPERREREYYRRIKDAFIHLEEEVKRGRISYYGISSNTFAEKETKQNFTSLEKVIAIANEISESNHFAVVQFPMNLIENGGMNNLNQQNQTKTFLQLAGENNLGVLVNRPLNAISKNKLIRLADYPVTEDRNENEIFS